MENGKARVLPGTQFHTQCSLTLLIWHSQQARHTRTRRNLISHAVPTPKHFSRGCASNRSPPTRDVLHLEESCLPSYFACRSNKPSLQHLPSMLGGRRVELWEVNTLIITTSDNGGEGKGGEDNPVKGIREEFQTVSVPCHLCVGQTAFHIPVGKSLNYSLKAVFMLTMMTQSHKTNTTVTSFPVFFEN